MQLEEGFLRPLPNLGDGSSLFFSHSTLDRPPVLLEYSRESERLEIWQQPGPSDGWSCLRQEKEFVSKDGVRVPVTILSTTPVRAGDRRPTVITGYGGFGVVLMPQYSTFNRILLDLGITMVLPHIRGGGEFGRPWHEAARREKRGVAVEDFLSAASWLLSEGIMSAAQHGIASRRGRRQPLYL